MDHTSLIKKIFFKNNTPLLSIASIEHILSVRSAVIIKKRWKMTDANFEKVMKIKYNKI